MQRLRKRGTSLLGSGAVPRLKRKALNSWAAVQDTYFSTKDTFERHKVIFTVGTSIASVATAWFGYTLRHYHESKVDQRLESIEKAMKSNLHLEHADIKKLVDPGPSKTAAWVATAGTALVVGYGLGWRGGTWYANRKFRKEQLKLLGQIKPKRWQLLGQLKSRGWQLRFLGPSARSRGPEGALKTSEKMPKNAPASSESVEACQSSAGSKANLFSFKAQENGIGMTAWAPSNDDGICKSMVDTKGYDCEEHTVTTQDGYILSLQRIPVGRSGGTPGNRPPVLLQHGLFMDGITWLLLPPEQSLAFALADNGYDVWLANSRGTKYSKGHTSLSPNDPAYWNWSWDELVAYDLPATFQYVHDQTGQKLLYVGHSLGTLTALAAFSKDELLNMLGSAALLSPIAYVGQMTSPLARNAADNFIAETLYWLGLSEFDPRGKEVVKLLKDICKKPGVDCTNLLTAFTGKNCCLNSSIVDIFLDHEPQPSATKNMIHLAQMVRRGTIAMYDYNDANENTKHYGQPTPPAYNMTSIPNDLPLFLSYGGEDALSDVNDVKLLLESLKDHDGDKLVVQYRNDYAHADYVMAENAKQDVYDPLIAFFRLQ
ncbi:hypothetical protein DITRI_Ditri11bG0041300 [Diplodiscus trichospermus]